MTKCSADFIFLSTPTSPAPPAFHFGKGKMPAPPEQNVGVIGFKMSLTSRDSLILLKWFDYMRLTPFQRQSILELSRKHFGSQCAAFLFGSRTNDESRGGDIDLLIEPDSNRQVEYSKRLAFRSELKCQIGDQKIDVIFAMPDDERPIVREARREMVRL